MGVERERPDKVFSGKAVDTFNEVVALQSDYALAWNELAFSYGYSSMSSRPSEMTPKAKAAIRRALELDDSLAEAHNNVAGMACFWDWDWDLALKESARAVELDPNYALGHFIRSRVLLIQNRLDESLEEMKKAQQLDPLSRPDAMIFQFLAMRRFDSSLVVAKPVEETRPDNGNTHLFLGYLYHRLGKSHEAGDEMAKTNFSEGDKDTQAARRLASGPDGYNAVLRLAIRIREEQAAHEYVPQMSLADLYGMLGDREGALHALENALKDHHLASSLCRLIRSLIFCIPMSGIARLCAGSACPLLTSRRVHARCVAWRAATASISGNRFCR